jgi:hypothetical protein
LDKSEFYNTYFADLFTDKGICDAVFDLYDLNRDGKIDDNEWMYAASTLVAGPEKPTGLESFSRPPVRVADRLVCSYLFFLRRRQQGEYHAWPPSSNVRPHVQLLRCHGEVEKPV